MKKMVIAILSVLLLAVPALTVNAGVLDDVRSEVRSSDEQDNENEGKKNKKEKKAKKEKHPNHKNGHNKHGHTNHGNSHHDGSSIEDLNAFVDICAFVGYAVTSPFWGPYEIWDGKWESTAYFVDYPYAEHSAGYMQVATSDRVIRQTSALRLSFDDSYDADGVNSLNFNFLVSGNTRLGFEWGASYLREEVDETTYDSMHMGDLNIVWRFVQSERLQMRAGIGMRYMNDYIGSETGFNFTYAADIYPKEPLIISASIDLGSLGEANVNHSRFSIGAILSNLELYAGYSFLKIGDVAINGPLGGLRAWF